MTKVARLFEEEKVEYVNNKINEIAKNLLEENVDILIIMRATGLSKAEILKLKENSEEIKK